MKVLEWLLLASVMAACIPLPINTNSDTSLLSSDFKTRRIRATTDIKRRQPQPSFLFLLGQFFGQTISETNQAVRNVTKIFNDQFTTTTPSPDMITDGDTNSTTESPPLPISRQQLFSILGNNYRGLVRLFNTEWQSALDQSSKNVASFRKEFREAVRPYFFPNRNMTKT